MTTVATRIRRIADLEGFDIVVVRNGQPVDVSENGVMAAWRWGKKSPGRFTVQRFKQKFEGHYEGLSCHVLREDGEIARGNTTLTRVRESYESDEE